MAETTTKRGRKPKQTTETKNIVEAKTNADNDMAEMLKQMQEQMAKLQKELNETKKAKEEATTQNLDLQTLVEALKVNKGVDGNLPNYVTIISLVPNTYNLSTENNGKGTVFTFEELGESKIISLSNVQKIMGISAYRQQAEQGYFYIVEDGVNEYFRLNQVNNTIDDIKNILSLNTEDCVDRFLNLNEKLQESLADRIALDISEGKKVDRNRVGEILDKTGIDIEEKARNLKKIMNK